MMKYLLIETSPHHSVHSDDENPLSKASEKESGVAPVPRKRRHAIGEQNDSSWWCFSLSNVHLNILIFLPIMKLNHRLFLITSFMPNSSAAVMPYPRTKMKINLISLQISRNTEKNHRLPSGK